MIIALKNDKVYFKLFSPNQKHLAIDSYSTVEKDEEANGLFVAMDDLKKLSYAFPNYLIDTRSFIDKYELYTGSNYWAKPR